MTHRRKIVLLVAALLPLIVVGGALLYLRFADLRGWRDTVSRLASDAIGRELRINGEFRPEIGLTTRVVAGDVTIANAEWSHDPHMLAVDRLDASIDLMSLLSGPITLRDISIDGARVLFETSEDGRFNWDLGSDEPSDPSEGPVELVLTDAELRRFGLVYAQSGKTPVKAEISHLGFTDDGTGMLDLELDGTFMDAPLEIDGRLGTFIGLINANAVTLDLRGRFGGSEFSTKGSVADLGSLSGIDSSVTIRGSSLDQPLGMLGLETGIDAPFDLTVSASPVARGSVIEFKGGAGEISATVEGTVNSLTDPQSLDVAVDLRGPDIRAVTRFVGIDELPSQPFSVTGRLAWAGFPVTFDDFDIRVGPNTLAAHGVLGGLPKMLGTDLRFDGEGPDISALAAVAGLKLPPDDYSVRGRLVRVEHGIRAEEVAVRLGASSLSADGFIGDAPHYSETSLELQAKIERPDRYSHLVARELPEETLEITGRIGEGDGAINLEGVAVRLGEHRVQLDGSIVADRGLVGSDVQVTATGPDLSRVAEFAGLTGASVEDYAIDGGLRIVGGGYELRDMVARVGGISARATGIVTSRPGLLGTKLDVSGSGPDLQDLAWLTTLDGAPKGAFEISGALTISERGYELDTAAARVGDITATFDGVITDAPGLENTEITADISGSELSALEPLLRRPGLPSAPFALAGGLRISSDGYEVDAVEIEVDGSRATLSGTVAATPNLSGTDLEVKVNVPDLEHMGRLAAGLADLPTLPAEPLVFSTRLAIDERGYLLEGLDGNLGRAEFAIGGRVGMPPRFVGTDLTIDSDGPDASLFKALTGVTIPVAPFRVQGRLQRTEEGFAFDQFSVQLAEHRLQIHGSLGELPKLIGTDLEVHAAGPETNLYEALAGIPDLPDKPFTLDGRFSGTPDRFSAREFRLTFGDSHLEGEFTVDITGKPAVEARLNSRVLDLRQLRDRVEAAKDANHATPSGAEQARKARGALVFRDEPLNFAWLQKADADVAIRIDQLYLRAMQVRDVAVDVHLEDGRLEIERAAAAGRGEGRMTASLLLEPRHEAYRLETDISFRHIRLDPPDAATELLQRPPIDVDIDLEAVGATPHELANSTNGAVQLVIGKGTFDSSMLDLVTADILLTLLNAFNPFAKEDPTTEMQCGVALLSISDGIAKLEPMAFQSDKMTLLGEGKINLATEKLNLKWVTKPRKGIGISASMVTNPYIKLGGTLADPSLELKPLEAVTSTGVAVATLGISWLAKGMLDRVTAEKKVCKKALEEIGQLTNEAPKNTK